MSTLLEDSISVVHGRLEITSDTSAKLSAAWGGFIYYDGDAILKNKTSDMYEFDIKNNSTGVNGHQTLFPDDSITIRCNAFGIMNPPPAEINAFTTRPLTQSEKDEAAKRKKEKSSAFWNNLLNSFSGMLPYIIGFIIIIIAVIMGYKLWVIYGG